MGSLPEWMAPSDAGMVFHAPEARSAARVVRRGLGGLVGIATVLLDDGLAAGRQGWLGRVDARAKLLGLLSVLVATTFLRNLGPLALCLGAAWALAWFGGLDMRRVALALLAVPAFTLALAAPAAFNVVTAGTPLVVLCHLGGGHWGPWRVPEFLTVTDRGLFVAARFALRSAACVSLASVLAAATRPQDLFKGLRVLGVPAAFVMVAAMMTRYLDLLLRSAEEIHLAKLSRSLGGVGVAREQAWAAAGMGELYRRSRTVAESVAEAMVSRGYTGEVHTLRQGRWSWQDGTFVAGCLAFGAALLALG